MSHATASSLPRLFTFVGADHGPRPFGQSAHRWATRCRLRLPAGGRRRRRAAACAAWALAGITSNERYVERHGEKVALVGAQAGLGRVEATRAAR